MACVVYSFQAKTNVMYSFTHICSYVHVVSRSVHATVATSGEKAWKPRGGRET